MEFQNEECVLQKTLKSSVLVAGSEGETDTSTVSSSDCRRGNLLLFWESEEIVTLAGL